jgi:hypothetical protein
MKIKEIIYIIRHLQSVIVFKKYTILKKKINNYIKEKKSKLKQI